MPLDVRLVVPCWNEAARLDVPAFEAGLSSDPSLALTFVDDGSRDATGAVLRALADAHPTRVDVVTLPTNRGKGEAVRAGLLHAIASRPAFVGWWDADLATPLADVDVLRRALLARDELVLAMGSRVGMLGAAIERRAVRHYAGRVVATWISRALRLATYDTQCGAKILKVAQTPDDLLAAPFLTRWLFDVEILARLELRHRAGQGPPPERVVVEVPLSSWREVPGSKVRPADFLRAAVELRRIRRVYGIRDPRS